MSLPLRFKTSILHSIFYKRIEWRMSSDYRRGWEDCLDTIYYELYKAGIRDPRVYRIIGELQGSVKEDKIRVLLDQLGIL